MTINEVLLAAAKRGMSAKRWGGSRLLTYNGFCHEQRVCKWQALDLAVRMGMEPPAEQLPCSVCGAPPSPAIAYHSEDYASMHGHYPVCRSCHMKIHNRFKNPERWRQFVASLDSGGKWFERLKPDDRAETTSMTATAPLRRNSEQKGKTMNFASDSPLPAGTTISQQMHAIRVAFVKAMGIESQPMNPNPAGGYKLEHNYAIREANLAEACRLRDEYADMVKKNGVGQNILDKMDSNLENRDRGAVWR